MSETFALGPPRMSAAELETFKRVLKGSRAYFELGMGGSSLLAVKAAIPTIVMVDSDPAWVAMVRRDPDIAAYLATGNLSILHANIGPVRDWGNPVDRTEIARWHTYLSVGWAEWARREIFPDLVFIDGRFRIACADSVVLATGCGKVAAAPRVMIHDFIDERPQYRQVLEFFDIEEQVESLCLLRMKRNASPAAALARLLRQQYDYG